MNPDLPNASPSGGTTPPAESADDFARQAETAQPSQLREMFAFIWHEKKWFLTPIVIVLLLAGLFIVLTGTAAAPFIYTVF